MIAGRTRDIRADARPFFPRLRRFVDARATFPFGSALFGFRPRRFDTSKHRIAVPEHHFADRRRRLRGCQRQIATIPALFDAEMDNFSAPRDRFAPRAGRLIPGK
jgi:hypothetical protein